MLAFSRNPRLLSIIPKEQRTKEFYTEHFKSRHLWDYHVIETGDEFEFYMLDAYIRPDDQTFDDYSISMMNTYKHMISSEYMIDLIDSLDISQSEMLIKDAHIDLITDDVAQHIIENHISVARYLHRKYLNEDILYKAFMNTNSFYITDSDLIGIPAEMFTTKLKIKLLDHHIDVFKYIPQSSITFEMCQIVIKKAYWQKELIEHIPQQFKTKELYDYLIENVDDNSVLRFIPDEFLNEEQRFYKMDLINFIKEELYFDDDLHFWVNDAYDYLDRKKSIKINDSQRATMYQDITDIINKGLNDEMVLDNHPLS